MKLKVRPEGRADVWLIDPKDLAVWLDNYFSNHKYIHNFIAGEGILIGADWNRKSFDDHLKSPDALWAVITSDDGVVAGHYLVCTDKVDDRWLRLVFDIGKIKPEDLEVLA